MNPRLLFRHAPLFISAVLLAVAFSPAMAADYTWTRPSNSGLWNAPANWTSGTFPNSSSADNIVGNVANSGNLLINGNYAVNNFTVTENGATTPWTIFANAPDTPGTLLISGTLTQGAGLITAFRNGVSNLGVTIGQVNMSGDLYLGYIVNAQALASLTVNNGVTLSGGNLFLNVAGDYGLGLLTGSGASNSTVNLVNNSQTGQSRTVTVSGLSSSGAGVMTIRTGTSNSTTANSAVLNIVNNSDYSSNAILEDRAPTANSGNTLALAKSGIGTQTLSGTSTYTGATTITGGVLSVSLLANGGAGSNIGASGTAASNLVLNGGTLRYTGTTASSNRLFSVGTAGGTLDASGSGLINFSNTGAMGFNGQTGARTLTLTGSSSGIIINQLAASIGDNGGATSLVKTGNTIWYLSGSSSYTGGTTINDGVIRTNKAASLGATSGAVTINSGTLQALTGYSDAREIRLGSSTSTIAVNSGETLTLTGTVRDDGANIGRLNKIIGGTVILTGSNTYTGGTSVSAGTLLINNTDGSGVGTGSITVGTSGTMGGSGIVTLASGSIATVNGVLTVGSAAAAETFEINTSGAGSLTFGTNAILTMDLWMNSLSGADVLATTGAVSLGSNMTLRLVNAGSLTFASGNQFNLFDWGSSPAGVFNNFDLPTLDSGLTWDTSALYSSGIITVVPEPSAVALMGLGLGLVLWKARRRV